MADIESLLEASELLPALDRQDAESVAEMLSECSGTAVYVRSVAAGGNALWAVGKRGSERLLITAYAKGEPTAAERFEGERHWTNIGSLTLNVTLCPAHHGNAAELRRQFAFASPQAGGLRKSIGCGDRLGNATPGHVRAVRGSGLFPVLAQQSVREMQRTGRSPEAVLDSATWGAFQSGWREGFGADADHLKTTDDVDATLAAGFVMFTVDPGEHVDDDADELQGAELQSRFEALPWDALQTRATDCLSAHEGRSVPLGRGRTLRLDGGAVMRAAVKYGPAVGHTAMMHRHLKRRAGKRGFELEMSVDETRTPTTPAEHAYVALELRRLAVEVVSLAPRFVGRFEKGVDYQGDVERFALSFEDHVAVARALGPYKLSVHSGSDKFSIYPVMADAAVDLIHVKTAGTSYLEALRVIGSVAPELFREVLAFALERYDEDRRGYHVSAERARVPHPDRLKDKDLPGLLDSFDARQVLHVTYGSVLTAAGSSRFTTPMLEALDEHEEQYCSALGEHLARHVDPFRAP